MCLAWVAEVEGARKVVVERGRPTPVIGGAGGNLFFDNEGHIIIMVVGVIFIFHTGLCCLWNFAVLLVWWDFLGEGTDERD